MKTKVVLTKFGKIFLMNQKKKMRREKKKEIKLRAAPKSEDKFFQPVMQGTSRRFMETLPKQTLKEMKKSIKGTVK
jgi:hypothetical protein